MSFVILQEWPGTGIKQNPDDRGCRIGIPSPGSQMKGGGVVRATCPDVSSCRNEELHGVRARMLRGDMQNRPAFDIGDVGSGTGFKQDPHDFRLPLSCCQLESGRRSAVRHLLECIGVLTGIKETVQCIKITVPNRVVKRERFTLPRQSLNGRMIGPVPGDPAIAMAVMVAAFKDAFRTQSRRS